MTKEALAVLQQALKILEKRGWAEQYNVGDNGRLNLRSALGRASRDLSSNDGYIQACRILTVALGGIQYWEFGSMSNRIRKPRTHDEVVGKLRSIVLKLEEACEKYPDGGGPDVPRHRHSPV